MKYKSFNVLMAGQSLANAGDVFYIVAIITSVYNVTNSLFYVSLVPVINMLGGFLGGLLAPLLIDRYKLKKILFNSQLVKTCILLVLTLYVSLFLSKDSIETVYIIIFFITFLDSFANPASSALIPQLVSEENLLKANSLMSSIHQFIQMGGWAAGGILAAFLHSNGLLILTFGLYVLSTFLLAFVKVKEKKQSEELVELSVKESKMTSMFEGWRLIAEDKRLRVLHLTLFFGSIASPVWVSSILYPFIDKRLSVGTEWWGYINTSLLLGLFLAGILAYRQSEFINKNIQNVLLLGGFMVFLMTFLFGVNVNPILSLLLIGLYGLFEELRMISIYTIIQSLVREKLLAKVYAVQSSLIMATFGISTLMMGILGQRYSIVVVFIVASISLCFSFINLITSRKYLTISIDGPSKNFENQL
ncbi:MFS transporter [Peribacillus frigoritolerans]|uniref:MFS transporter n=1 Tax=Peribacillus frigoritolerans TaxID=450367 RepID=UPI002280D56C|nr:MFS transporter [Peribacillus frigoritolerans]MCY8939435.1 MFS transporter [Peribacillus frigoritolerans]